VSTIRVFWRTTMRSYAAAAAGLGAGTGYHGDRGSGRRGAAVDALDRIADTDVVVLACAMRPVRPRRAPVAASPVTVISGSRSKTRRSPLRTIAWSSAGRRGSCSQRKLRAYQPFPPRLARHAKSSAELHDPLLHPEAAPALAFAKA